jgi:two-component system response regulator CpxR
MRLLLIDDDQKFVRLLMNLLKAEGYEVSAAYEGAAGLQMVRAQSWDLVILDVMLPRIDGFEVLKQMRAFSRVPVLMLTGRGAEEDLITGLDRGADDYLPKTSSARELTARIRAVLRRASMQASDEEKRADQPREEIVVGELKLIPEGRQAYLDRTPIELTPVEFAILTYLAQHKGRIRSREQLLEAVRERRFALFDRSIDVHIASLRRKLGDDARCARFIRTIRNVGYMLVDSTQGE